jgi:hypothetical protein
MVPFQEIFKSKHQDLHPKRPSMNYSTPRKAVDKRNIAPLIETGVDSKTLRLARGAFLRRLLEPCWKKVGHPRRVLYPTNEMCCRPLHRQCSAICVPADNSKKEPQVVTIVLSHKKKKTIPALTHGCPSGGFK